MLSSLNNSEFWHSVLAKRCVSYRSPSPKASLQSSDKRLMVSFFNRARIINWYRKDMATAVPIHRFPLYQPHDPRKPSRTQFFTDQLHARSHRLCRQTRDENLSAELTPVLIPTHLTPQKCRKTTPGDASGRDQGPGATGSQTFGDRGQQMCEEFEEVPDGSEGWARLRFGACLSTRFRVQIRESPHTGAIALTIARGKGNQYSLCFSLRLRRTKLRCRRQF